MTLHHHKNSWKQFMGELSKKRMNCGCKFLVRKPFLPLIIKAKPSILILPKFKPKLLSFGFLMILNYLIGQLPIFYLLDYGFVRIFTTHLFSNLQFKKQFRNLQMQIYQASCFKIIQTMKKISFLGLCLHTKRAHC